MLLSSPTGRCEMLEFDLSFSNVKGPLGLSVSLSSLHGWAGMD